MTLKKATLHLWVPVILSLLPAIGYAQTERGHTVQFIFTSDVHFGLDKEIFRGKHKVSSLEVNAAMIEQMNAMPGLVLPYDTGVNAGRRINSIDAVVITGDLANREENGIQSAAVSWNQFLADYTKLLRLKTASKKKARLLITPGNHDVSNAIGFWKPMTPVKNAASMTGIYNLMMHPATMLTVQKFDYRLHKVHYSASIGDVHCMFVNLWPDSAERVWMEKDLLKVNANTPVFLFTHSMPDVEARFFINPNGKHDVNDHDKFENLVTENFKDGDSINVIALKEQRGFVAFLKQHPNIKAYFHGHSNYTEFYNWKGPDNDILLHCFRADSPLKGKYSIKDETKLSFELVSVNTTNRRLTVREVLWNSQPAKKQPHCTWGTSTTVSF